MCQNNAILFIRAKAGVALSVKERWRNLSIGQESPEWTQVAAEFNLLEVGMEFALMKASLGEDEMELSLIMTEDGIF